MIAATIAATLLAAMPAATGDTTVASSLTQTPPDSARGAITAKRHGPQRVPAKIIAGRQTLAAWRCAILGRAIRCRSDRRVDAARKRYRVQATYVSFRGTRTTRTSVRVGRVGR